MQCKFIEVNLIRQILRYVRFTIYSCIQLKFNIHLNVSTRILKFKLSSLSGLKNKEQRSSPVKKPFKRKG